MLFLRASNHQLADRKIKLNLLFNLSNLNSNLPLTLGHLNPALNNPAPEFSFPSTSLIKTAFPAGMKGEQGPQGSQGIVIGLDLLPGPGGLPQIFSG